MHLFQYMKEKRMHLKDTIASFFSWTLFLSQILLISQPDKVFYSISSFISTHNFQWSFIERINKFLLGNHQSFLISIERIINDSNEKRLLFDIRMKRDNSDYLNFDLRLNKVQLNFSLFQLLNGFGAIKQCWIDHMVGDIQTSFGNVDSNWSYKSKFGDFYLSHLSIKRLDVKIGNVYEESSSFDHFWGVISLNRLRKPFLLFDLINAEHLLVYSKFNFIEIEKISNNEQSINCLGLDLIYRNRFVFDSRFSSLHLKTKICDNFIRAEYNMNFGAISDYYHPFFAPISKELKKVIYSVDILMDKIKGKWTIYETDIGSSIVKSILSKVTRLIAMNITKYEYMPILSLFARDQNIDRSHMSLDAFN